ncbi:MAG: glycosyltransferase family 4 protein [Actinomycetota bacterium]
MNDQANSSDDELRVLLVTKGLDLGGIERVVTDLAIGLSARGVDVEVALVNSTRDRLAPPVESAGVTIHRLDGSDRIGAPAARRFAALTRRSDLDVVHVHGPLPAAIARLAKRSSTDGARLVTTAHTPWTSLHPATRAAWWATMRRDDAIVAVSSATAATLPGSSRRRAVVIPHGIDPKRIDAARQQVLDRGEHRDVAHESAATTQTITAVAVASHRDAKNYPNLLQSVRAANEAGADVRLVAIGDGPNLDEHQLLAHTLGIGDRVEFRPSTDDALVEIAGSDVLVVASDYEGQPIVVAEALALGVPVVSTAVGRAPEMVSRRVGRIVPPGDPAALGSAIAELAADPQLRANMARAARTQRAAWTLDDVIDAHLDLYAEVLHERADPGN